MAENLRENGRRGWWQLFKQAFADWQEDKCPRLGAALAYYTVFSLAPILVIAIAVAGLLFEPATVQEYLGRELSGMVGESGREGITAMVEGAQKRDSGVLATVIGVVALLFGAGGVFGQLKDALNTIWEVEPKPGRGIVGMIHDRFLSFAMVAGIAFLLLVSLVASTVLTAIQEQYADMIPGPDIVAHVLNFVVSFAVVTVLFALIFKVLPDAKIRWRHVWPGALLTAALFSIGKFALSQYLGRAAFASAYGAAGSVIVILLWAYYSAQILFFGAEFTQAYAKSFGEGIQPAEHARTVTQESRAQQGMSGHAA